MKIDQHHNEMYFFHITDCYHGDEWLMKPRKIKSSEDKYHHINRICVAPTYEQCLIALINFKIDQNWFIYRTKYKVDHSIKPCKNIVTDVIITDERWIMEPVEMVLVGEINALTPNEEDVTFYTNKNFVNPDVTIEINNQYIPMDYNDRGHDFGISRQNNILEKTRELLDRNLHPFYDKNDLYINLNQRNVKIK